MKTLRKIILIAILAFFSSPVQTIAQNTNGLSEQQKKTTINSISDTLIDSYVFPEVGKKMSEFIQEKLKDGEYGTIDDAMEFAQQITTDLRSVSNDLHLNVRYMPQNNEGPANMIMAPPVDQLVRLKRDNFGFHEVKILDGNIGYLDLRGFVDTTYGGETAVAAMNFLSNADALIIDLRQNGGGQPSMIQLISSYLFEGSVHLNDFYWRPTDEYSQNWTLPHVPGKRRPDIDVYVLTSSYSFSAAEEFAYNLKHLDRATIIGETTRGGAHPGSSFRAGDQFDIWVPQGRAINPITNTNWEGTGVKPHIQIEADKALLAGQVEALKSLKESARDKWSSKYYDFYLRDLEAELEPVTLDEAALKSYAGTYGPRTITYENAKLHYQRIGTDNPKSVLKALGNNWFDVEGVDYFKVEFIMENDEVVAITGHYDNGSSDTFRKSK